MGIQSGINLCIWGSVSDIDIKKGQLVFTKHIYVTQTHTLYTGWSEWSEWSIWSTAQQQKRVEK